MVDYLIRRFMNMLLALVVISFLSFVIIQLPPGDYLTSYITRLRAQGEMVSEEMVASLTMQYGLDKSFMGQYWKWITNFVQGDMGQSFRYQTPVNELVWERIGLTLVISTFLAACSSGSWPSRWASMWRCGSIRRATTWPPSSASSVWPSPTSCWRWC